FAPALTRSSAALAVNLQQFPQDAVDVQLQLADFLGRRGDVRRNRAPHVDRSGEGGCQLLDEPHGFLGDLAGVLSQAAPSEDVPDLLLLSEAGLALLDGDPS